MQLKSIVTVLILMTCCGCGGRQIVRVIDSLGQPIAGAKVEAVSLSVNSSPNITNERGEAILPSNVQGAKWIDVQKQGYERANLDLPTNWPLVVTLKPASRQ